MNIIEDLSDFWNVLNILILAGTAAYCVAYAVRHKNGKKNLRIFTAMVLVVTLAFRLHLLFGAWTEKQFSQLQRPWSVLIIGIILADAYIDWQHKKRISGA